MHAANRVANKPLASGGFRHRLTPPGRASLARSSTEKSPQKRNAPGEHDQPKQKPQDASQNLHTLSPREKPLSRAEPSVCNGKRARQTKMCDFNGLRGGRAGGKRPQYRFNYM